MSKVIAANTSSPTAIPIPEIDVPDPSTDFGDGNDFGDGWGVGDGSGAGGGFGNIPTSHGESAALRPTASNDSLRTAALKNVKTPLSPHYAG